MVGVDHIHVPQVRRSRFVRHVHGVLQGQIPYGEGFEFCISRLDSALVFVIELRKAGGEFAASGTGRGNDYQRFGRLYIGVCAVAFVADYRVYVGGIALCLAVDIHLFAAPLQLAHEHVRRGLTFVLGDGDGIYGNSQLAYLVYKAKHVHIVGYAEVGAYFIALDIARAHHEYYLRLVFESAQNVYFGVVGKAGQYARRVHIVKKFAAEFQIQFIVEFFYSLQNFFRLQLRV